MKWLIKSADLLSLSPCPSLKKSRHLKLAFNFRIYCCIFVANQRSHDLFITEKTESVCYVSWMKSLFFGSLEADFSMLLCLAACWPAFHPPALPWLVMNSSLPCWRPAYHTYLRICPGSSPSAAPLLWLLPWRNETCLLVGAWYAAAKAEECVLQWVLTFTFAACPNW